MFCTKFQVSYFFAPEDFQRVFTIMGMVAILVKVPKPFEQTFDLPTPEI